MSFLPGHSGVVTNGATPVTLVAAPGERTQRMIKVINIVNLDTAAITVLVKIVTSGGSSFVILDEEIGAGETGHARDVVLDKTTDTITVQLAGAVAATEADCTATYADLSP